MKARCRRVMMASRRFAVILAMAAVALVPAVFCSFGSVHAQTQVQNSEADSKAIKQAFAEFYEAFSRHDTHAVAMTFAEDLPTSQTWPALTTMAARRSKTISPEYSR